MKVLRVLLFTLIALALLIAYGDREGDGAGVDGLRVGLAAPPLEVAEWLDVKGGGASLADLRGRVVLLDFWGAWCAPCRSALPRLEELHEAYAGDGLSVIGVHTTRGSEDAPAYLAERPLSYPVAVDLLDRTARAYGVRSVPRVVLIDRGGVVRYPDLALTDVDAAVSELLAEDGD